METCAVCNGTSGEIEACPSGGIVHGNTGDYYLQACECLICKHGGEWKCSACGGRAKHTEAQNVAG
jgi:hypothetical protein